MSNYRRNRLQGGCYFLTIKLLERRMDYLHYNPVKHGHVSHVQDWGYDDSELSVGEPG